MWVSVLKAYKAACKEAEAIYLAKIKSLFFHCALHMISPHLILSIAFSFTDEQNISFVLNMRMRTWQALRSTVCEKPADIIILEKLRNDFRKHFLNDEHGDTRVWTLFDNVKDAFEKAKNQVCEFVVLILL